VAKAVVGRRIDAGSRQEASAGPCRIRRSRSAARVVHAPIIDQPVIRADEIRDLAVRQVQDVLLESQPEHGHRFGPLPARLVQLLADPAEADAMNPAKAGPRPLLIAPAFA
jgi:hypothetical protein